jgi:hypothetical protein
MNSAVMEAIPAFWQKTADFGAFLDVFFSEINAECIAVVTSILKRTCVQEKILASHCGKRVGQVYLEPVKKHSKSGCEKWFFRNGNLRD